MPKCHICINSKKTAGKAVGASGSTHSLLSSLNTNKPNNKTATTTTTTFPKRRGRRPWRTLASSLAPATLNLFCLHMPIKKEKKVLCGVLCVR